MDGRNVSGVDGKRYYRLLGQGGVIAQHPQAHAPPTDIPSPSFPTTGSPLFLQPASYNLLPTTCFLQPASYNLLPTTRFLHLVFFTTHRPPLPNPLAPALSPWDTLAVTISRGKGSAARPKASASGTTRTDSMQQGLGFFFLGFLLALSYGKLL